MFFLSTNSLPLWVPHEFVRPLSELLRVRKLGYYSHLQLMSSMTQVQLISSPGVFAHL